MSLFNSLIKSPITDRLCLLINSSCQDISRARRETGTKFVLIQSYLIIWVEGGLTIFSNFVLLNCWISFPINPPNLRRWSWNDKYTLETTCWLTVGLSTYPPYCYVTRPRQPRTVGYQGAVSSQDERLLLLKVLLVLHYWNKRKYGVTFLLQ